MTFVRTFFSIATLTTAALATTACAAVDDQHDGHHPAQASTVQVAQATPASPGMGMAAGQSAGAAMPGYADQMKAMHDMHEKMMAAHTPDQRNALMAEQMKLMHNGMNMMGGMGGMGGGGMMGGTGASARMAGKPADMATRQGMMEQHMDMMQSMMQMMMDRMQSIPATK
jgi:hypothetical protein